MTIDTRQSSKLSLPTGDGLHYGALLLIVLLAIAVRLPFLTQLMRYDEAATFTNYAPQSVRVITTDYAAPNNHILHSILVRVAYLASGNRAWALRLPALIAGVLVVPAVYLALRALYDKEAALLTAAATAGSSYLLEYSTNARGYSMIALFTLLMLALVCYLIEHDRLLAWGGLATLAALGAYVAPAMLYPAGLVVIWLGLSVVVGGREGRRRPLLHLAGSMLLAGVLALLFYAPVFLRSGPGAVLANSYVAPLPWSAMRNRWQRAFPRLWTARNHDVPAWLGALLVVGAIASLALHWRIARHPLPLVVGAALWLPPLTRAQRVVPFTRVWLFLLPICLGFACAGLVGLYGLIPGKISALRPIASAGAALAPALVLDAGLLSSRSVYYSEETGTYRGAQAAALYLKDYLRPGESVLVPESGAATVRYYFDLYGVPPAYLIDDPRAARRIIVLTKKATRAAADEVLALRDVTRAGYGEPRLARALDLAAVYELARLP